MIKFRAWDGYRKIMADYVSAIQNGDTQGTPSSVNVIVNRKNETWDIKNDDVELLQFTGLKDVNGNEIYEGDIVKTWSDVSELTMVPSINEIVSEDLFGRPGVFLKPAGPHLIEPCLHDSWSNQFEVIGNVHENPELLEENK
ncbi:prophage Lp2 protein 26 [Lactiplantibacillus plantarum]|nr:prophage Lp2 protein 26 [Lactiplantibacillus plantarum]MCG0598711.1 prophage Lp2 protein 26 [Lactiplantibacillus plantarum]MCG0600630.1 prophage Lp2 protein 26 [Lactiplantibacillus plantarum]MCG0603626.1 prophage Lp2 protein 26 [Lactiplantibacillus plantarum]MCG0741191.1 prophage Lp2 protein 26 [Lactiplantibacillus plantarum]